jgi:2-dehydropantoate 2-reductase
MTTPSPGSNTPPARIAVMGAGAVGCYYGAMLARAGHEVVLIGRPAHVEAIQRQGLRFEARGLDERLRVAASTHAQAVRGAQLVLFCVKSTDTEAAAAEMQPHLDPGALLLTLQNGVDNAERLRGVLRSQPVAAAVVYVATEMAGPGHVRHHGLGELLIEPSPGSEAVRGMLEAAGVPTEVSANVRGALWAKLTVNCAYNALSAIARLPYGPLAQGEGVGQVMRDVAAECLAVARAEGIEVPGDMDAAVRRIAQTMPTQFSSTAQDLARARRSEIDHLNGLVVRRGEALGVPTPANRVLHALVKLLEGRSPSP